MNFFNLTTSCNQVFILHIREPHYHPEISTLALFPFHCENVFVLRQYSVIITMITR